MTLKIIISVPTNFIFIVFFSQHMYIGNLEALKFKLHIVNLYMQIDIDKTKISYDSP